MASLFTWMPVCWLLPSEASCCQTSWFAVKCLALLFLGKYLLACYVSQAEPVSISVVPGKVYRVPCKVNIDFKPCVVDTFLCQWNRDFECILPAAARVWTVKATSTHPVRMVHIVARQQCDTWLISIFHLDRKLKKFVRAIKDKGSAKTEKEEERPPQQWNLDYALAPFEGLTPEYMEMSESAHTHMQKNSLRDKEQPFRHQHMFQMSILVHRWAVLCNLDLQGPTWLSQVRVNTWTEKHVGCICVLIVHFLTTFVCF